MLVQLSYWLYLLLHPSIEYKANCFKFLGTEMGWEGGKKFEEDTNFYLKEFIFQWVIGMSIQ